MPRGAARDEHHALDGLHRRGVEAHVGEHDAASLGRDAAAEGVGDGARLLVDLLEHEVPVATLLGHDRIPQDLDRLALHGIAVDRRELDALRGDHGHVVVLEDDDVARVRQDRRNVRSDEHLTASQAHHHAAGALLGGDEAVGGRAAHHADRVRARDLVQRGAHGRFEPARLFQMVLDQMREHLGVGLRAERVAGRPQPLLDLEIVLEDPVVYDDEAAAAVGVRMRVLFRRTPVRGPARVADTDRAGDRLVTQSRLQRLDPAHRAPHLQPAAIEHGHARGVVAAVLQPLQPIDDDADRALVPDVADDSAHGGYSFGLRARFAAKNRAAQPSFTTWGARSTASASSGTSLVITEPAAT